MLEKRVEIAVRGYIDEHKEVPSGKLWDTTDVNVRKP